MMCENRHPRLACGVRRCVTLGRTLLWLVVASLLAVPTASGLGNADARVHVSGAGNAVAVCQIVILAGAVVYLGIEDGLGLASMGTGRDAVEVIIAGSGAPVATATCESVIGELRVSGMTDVVVTGGAPLSPWTHPDAPGPRKHVVVDGPDNHVEVCQLVVVVGSVIFGGSAYGMTSGHSHGPLVLGGSDPGSAACKVAVGKTVVMRG